MRPYTSSRAMYQSDNSPVIIHLSREQVENLCPSVHVWTYPVKDWIIPDGRQAPWDTAESSKRDKRREAIRLRRERYYPSPRFSDPGVPFVMAALVTRLKRQKGNKHSIRRTPCRNEMQEKQGLSGVVEEQTWRDDRDGKP